MGRRKISIQRIHNERKRRVTFNKRKVGLIKKAIELSVLCDCDIGMVILKQGKVFQYSSSDLEQILAAHRSYEGPIESLSNDAHDMLKPGRSLPREEFMQSKKSSVPPPLDPLRAQYPVHIAQMAQTAPTQTQHLDTTAVNTSGSSSVDPMSDVGSFTGIQPSVARMSSLLAPTSKPLQRLMTTS